jgi:hypothetical protein
MARLEKLTSAAAVTGLTPDSIAKVKRVECQSWGVRP